MKTEKTRKPKQEKPDILDESLEFVPVKREKKKGPDGKVEKKPTKPARVHRYGLLPPIRYSVTVRGQAHEADRLVRGQIRKAHEYHNMLTSIEVARKAQG